METPRLKASPLVAGLHAMSRRGVLYVTGGGSLLLSDLLTVPGASSTVLEASVPYSARALAQLLGAQPEKACSDATARALSMCAFKRAHQLTDAPDYYSDDVFGFALTASLRTGREKRGEHRAHLALQTRQTTRTWLLALEKNGLTREAEERLVADVALGAIATSFGLDVPDDPSAMASSAALTAEADIQALVLGERSFVGDPQDVFFPGAFNPLHEGHRLVKADAQVRLGKPVQYELCIQNVDKPPLDYFEIERRRRQFGANELVLTNTPTFTAKAAALNGPRPMTFVVGIDTLERIGQARYYGGEYQRDEELDRLYAAGVRFLVYGRLMDGRFHTLEDLDLPAALAAMSTGVLESEFRADYSSTELRVR